MSSDLLETWTEQIADVAADYAGRAYEMYGDWEIVSRAIDYIRNIQDGPWQGEEWFRHTLHVVTELAVPDTGLDADAATFLPDLQRGIAQSFQSAPVERRVMQLSDDDVRHVLTLQEVGKEYGLVSDLLDVCEKVLRGDPLAEKDQWILKLASSAAPFTRVARNGN